MYFIGTCIFNLFKIFIHENRNDCSRRQYFGKEFLEKMSFVLFCFEKMSFETNCKKWTLDDLRGELPGSKTKELSVWKWSLFFRSQLGTLNYLSETPRLQFTVIKNGKLYHLLLIKEKAKRNYFRINNSEAFM